VATRTRRVPRRAKGPFFSALICERVLTEQDGALSAIRIIDQLTLEDPGRPEPRTIVVPVPVRLALLVTVKAHPVPGRHRLRVEARTPAGVARQLGNSEIEMQLPDAEGLAGANLVAQLEIGLSESGTYWFDVYLDDEFRTAVPLRVLRAASIRPLESPGKARESKSGRSRVRRALAQ
jgi:hypothetical protein